MYSSRGYYTSDYRDSVRQPPAQWKDYPVDSGNEHEEYPPHKPFINDDYTRDPKKPIKAFPESNRQAVMSALKGLQDKIQQLELERSVAEDNLKSLADETSKFQDLFPSEQEPLNTSQQQGNLTQQNHDVYEKLDSAEQRCQLLERQLEHMRRMLQKADTSIHARTRSPPPTSPSPLPHSDDIKHKLDKIGVLEREHLKLTATQTLAESKIRELENRLKEERLHRKRMQNKAAELETAAQTNRILMATSTTVPRNIKKVKKKKKRATSARGSSNTRPVSARSAGQPAEHYKLNLAEIPFVAGKSTAPSHSLPANFQEVLSLMKTHNSHLCKSPRQHCRPVLPAHRSESSSSGISSGTDSDVNDLLLQLQDEFGKMSFEHQELTRQIQDAFDWRLKDDLDRELDSLVTRMEAKGEQIARLRRHQNQLQSRKNTKRRKSPTCGSSKQVALPSEMNGEVEVTTTIRTKGKNVGSVVVRPTTCGTGGKAQASLNLLKDLKKIQTTLRKDDLCWDD